jgi:16S rRNA (guanine527-N7)-methyltransferase
MNENELPEVFEIGLKDMGISLSREILEKFFIFKELVLDWNNKVNLTSIIDSKEFIIKHFIDSLTLIPYLNKQNSSIIDIGSGAGFPGIPIKLALSHLDITLLDSLEKRVKFLDFVIEELKLTKIKAIHCRAEDAGVNPNHREKYDYCLARAVAPLPVLVEYCLPFVKIGGNFLAMKGLSKKEIENSKNALTLLGGQIEEIKDFKLPLTDNNRNIIIIRKIRQTPTKFPRKSGKPSKNPIK